jgi:two-component system, sensor histidine kinase PdtaS
MKTVRSRLLRVMSLIVMPVGVVIVIVAYAGYAADVRDIRTIQTAAASDRARTIRSWFDTVERSLADLATAAKFLDADRCAALAQAFVRRNEDYAAVRLVDANGRTCAAGEAIDLSQLPPPAPSRPAAEAGFRVQFVGTGLLMVTTAPAPGAGPEPTGALVLEPDALRSRLKPIAALGEENVALIVDGRRLVSQWGDEGSVRWLPEAFPETDPAKPWVARDRAGREAAFVLAPAFGPSFSILTQFDEQRRIDARRRVVALCLAPLALLALLTFAYASSIQRDVVRWIKGIEAAARARSRDPDSPATAPVNARMPSELRSVAQTFNAMAEHVSERQRALETSLAENQALMQEMHHRIKNSLQVILSYLTLLRRMEARADYGALTRISGRISVFAVAYRIALTPGGMRPVSIKPFLDEVATALFTSLRRPCQRTTAILEWDGELEVDRAIPLGLAMVEAITAAIDGAGSTFVEVRLLQTSEREVELIVAADGARADDQPPDRIMNGLASQLGATREKPSEDQVLCCRFAP